MCATSCTAIVQIAKSMRSSAFSKAGARLLNSWPQWLRRGRPWRLGSNSTNIFMSAAALSLQFHFTSA
jgi:hypothetical protein